MTKEETLYINNKEKGKHTIIPYCLGAGISNTGTCVNCVWFCSSLQSHYLEPDKCLLQPCGNPYSVVCTDKDCINCDITFCLWYGKEFPRTEEEKKIAYEKHRQTFNNG